MKRHYELVYSNRGLEFIGDYFPELAEGENDILELENDNTPEGNYNSEDGENYKNKF